MNTNAIRDVATRARRQLIEAVERRCLLYGIEEGSQGDVDTVNGRVLSAAERAQRRELLHIQGEMRGDGKPGTGHAALVEKAAYTWFNRLFAIRFMELNDRLPSHVRMLSAQDGSFVPECLREAMDLPLDALDRAEVAQLVAEGDDEGLFRLILLAQCAELAECMPAVFERVGSAMELLLPDGLLAKDGVVESLVTGIPEDDWREGVEIVGWAYQFYMTEVRAELQNVKVSRNQIGTATQLYTPEWIVRYLVDNSVGRIWALNNPQSPLIASLNYFVADEEDGATSDFLRVSSPEEITVIDPACGSGHILCYAFDVLATAYEECGYRRRDIPKLILERNLTGVEIDSRAGQLAAFSLAMKACEWDARFLKRGVAPHIVVLDAVELTQEDLDLLPHTLDSSVVFHESKILAHLDEVGSLWTPTSEYLQAVRQVTSGLEQESGIFANATLEKLRKTERYAEVLAENYAVAVANPPYRNSGKMAPWISSWLKDNYPDEKADLFAAFTWRMLDMRRNGGMVSIASSNSWMFISTYEKARKKLLQRVDIATLVQLSVHGYEGVAAQVFAFACQNKQQHGYKGGYIRLNDFDHHSLQGPKTLEAIRDKNSYWFYRADAANFSMIPGSPIAYWASEGVLEVFKEQPISSFMLCKSGITTGSADFIRVWFEVSRRRIKTDCASSSDMGDYKWFPLNSGGDFRKYYGNNQKIVNLWNDGYDIQHSNGNYRLRDKSLYFREGLTWGRITSAEIAFREAAPGTLFGDAGPVGFVDKNRRYLLGFLCSTSLRSLLEMLNPTLNFQIADVNRLPLVINPACRPIVEELVSNNIDAARSDWDSFETSWDFTTHSLVRTNRISSAYGLWSAECKDRYDTLRQNEEELNRIFARIYHMEGEVPIEVPEDKVSVRRADLARDVKSLISYAVGCMFGRYSLDKPGLVLANQGDGLPQYLAQVPHPRYMPDDDGILPITDDEYFEDDIVAMLCEWLRKAYGPETLEENLQFIADALGGTGSPRRVIRDYFMNQFFKDHCATYSVQSAGKRPIYWLIDSGKLGGFRALVYMHRYTPDLLARVRTDYVHERQERYRSRISELVDQREGVSRSGQSAIDKELKRLRAQLDEVTKFEERLHHLADQMIEIDLDDGFKVNYAKFADVMAKVK